MMKFTCFLTVIHSFSKKTKNVSCKTIDVENKIMDLPLMKIKV